MEWWVPLERVGRGVCEAGSGVRAQSGHGMGSQASLRTTLPQYPLITDFGEEHGFPLYELKDGSLLEVEKVSLQQRLNQFQHEVSPCFASQPTPAPLAPCFHHFALNPIMPSAFPKSASALPVSIGDRNGEVGEPPLLPVKAGPDPGTPLRAYPVAEE